MFVSIFANNIKTYNDKHSKIANYQSMMPTLASQVENKCAVTNKSHAYKERKKHAHCEWPFFQSCKKFRNVKKYCVRMCDIWSEKIGAFIIELEAYEKKITTKRLNKAIVLKKS